MARLLAAISRDTHRLHLVSDIEEAKRIVEAIFGVEPEITDAHDTHALNDFWVVLSDAVIVKRAEYITYRMVDAAVKGVGRVTASVYEE